MINSHSPVKYSFINDFFRPVTISIYLFFVLFTVYYAQGWLYAEGGIISRACLLLILLVSSAYFGISLFIKGKKCLFYNAWTLLLLLNVIGFLFTGDFSNAKHTQMFKNILGAMLPFYAFYYFALKKELKAGHLIAFTILILPILIYRFYFIEDRISVQMDIDEVNVVNNTSYSFIGLIPFIFLVRRSKILAGLLMIIIVVFVIQGAKRGAIVACTLGLLMYFYYQLKTIEKRDRLRSYIVLFASVIILGGFAYKTSLSNTYMLSRMVSMIELNSSNRDVIYTSILDRWYNSEGTMNFLTGFGFAGSRYLAGKFAHNDWLELLSNFGLIGVGLYLFLFYSAIKLCFNKEWLIEKRILMMTIVLIWFFISLISMWYTSMGTFMYAMLFGYLTGNKEPGFV